LRMRSGLGLRELARRMGLSVSSYGHYEDPSRFKAPFLRMDIARRIADALADTGIDRAEVLALAGAATPEPGTPQHDATGLGEDAEIYLFREQPVPKDSEHLTLRALFGDRAGQPVTFRVTTALPGLGLWPGDVVVADLRRNPRDGEVGIVTLPDGNYAIRRLATPFLLAGDPVHDAAPLRADQEGVTLRFAVIGAIRGLTQG